MSQLHPEPARRSLWPLPARERQASESVLFWLAVALTFATLAELLRSPEARHFTAADGWWLNILPAAWFVQTCYRASRGHPFDRASVTVGLFCLTPYVFSTPRHQELPEYLRISLVLFLAAFALGFWFDLRRERSQA
jgi:hypothetical protein